MKTVKILSIAVLIFVLGASGYFGYQKFVINKGLITDVVVPPLSEEKEAFEIFDPSVEETKKIPLKILAIKPNIENTPEVRQISVTFNKPMVSLDDFEKSAQDLLITIEPKINCHWRWLNRMSLGCQLDEALPPSNRYKIKISKGFKAFDGTALSQDETAVFTTSKWKVVRDNIEWKDADIPVIYWTFNQPMLKSSLQKNIKSTCGLVKVDSVSKEIGERYSVDILRTYSILFDKKIGLSKNCNLSLPAFVEASSGKEPGSSYSHNFQTYPDFAITNIQCQYKVGSNKPEGAKFKVNGCDPNTGVTIELSTPVFAKDLIGNIQVEPFFGWSKGGRGSPEYFAQNPDELYSRIILNSPLNGRDNHTIKLNSIKDQFGRSLIGPDTVEISTIDFRPKLNISDHYGVLEKKGPHQVAYSAVNLKQFQFDYYQSNSVNDLELWKYFENRYNYCLGRLKAKPFSFNSLQVDTGAQLNIPITNPIDLDKIIPNFKFGMFLGSVKSPKVFESAQTEGYNLNNFCKNFFLVITDLGIMAKVGFYDSGVWIHSIATGKPLSGIEVQLRGYEKVLAEGKTNSEGFVKFAGASEWDPERAQFKSWGVDEELFVIAKTDDDLSVLPFYQGTRGISAYDFSNYGSGNYFYSRQLSKSSNHIVHAITDRPLYQPDQSVKIKLFARHWEPRTFGLAPDSDIEVIIRDSRGKEIHKEMLKLSEYGTANTEFKLDSGSPLGSYSIVANIDSKWQRTIGFFDVQEFTLPAFKVGVKPIKTRFLVGESAAFRTSAQYHFGGGVAKTSGSYTASFQEEQWQPTLPKWKDYHFDDQVSLNLAGYEKPRSLRHIVVEDGKLLTDKNGDSFKQILLSQNQIRSYGTVTFELKFEDDRGKTIAGRSGAKVFYSEFQLGLRKDKWAYEAGEEIEPKVVLVNSEELSINRRPITLKLIHRSYQTIRVRGTGNYFGYETRTSDKVVDECKTISVEDGASCVLKAKAAGSHFILAEAKDSKGQLAQSSLHLYVTGSDYVGWYRENHDRIDIIPDKDSYNVGDEISLLIKNPYQEVEGIFTLERFGILKQFRRKLSGGAEIVKIPLDSKDYAPGFYVSVSLIKGRVSEKIEGGVDLGKPSFKMGLAKIKVVNPDTLLEVEVSTNKSQYEIGEEVDAKIHIKSSAGNRRAEVSIAVVDEKILQLAGSYKDKFDLHDKFYEIPGVEVMTSQMLSYLIGRRHFGRKGVSEGGDGEGIAVRKNFLPLAYWNPALETDLSGKANFKFKIPDNLTSWRILVVAVDKEHRFGFGGTSFKANKKVMIEPALPSFLTEGDQLKSRFSVFNRSGNTGSIIGSIKTEGLDLLNREDKKIDVDNDGKGFLEWLVKAPFGAQSASLTVKAELEGTALDDAAQYSFPIRPFVSYEIFTHYGSSIESNTKIPVKIPEGIRPELGGLEVIYSPSLISHLDDVIRYGLDYPYSCWEQKLVKALMLNSYVNLKDYISIPDIKRDPITWIRELLNKMPNYQAPNGGMSFWKPDLRTVDPYLSVFTALGMVWINQSNVPIPESSTNKVFEYTKNLLEGRESFPNWYTSKVKATVLAMAVYVRGLLGDKILPSLNRIYQDKDNLSLFGKSFLWSAASNFVASSPIAEELKKSIFSMADLTSGQIQFQELHDDGFQRILHSTTRTNCRLLVSLLESDPKGPFVEPLVRWIIGNRKANRWNNTQENLYCLNALTSYAKIFEKEIPNFKIASKAFGVPLKDATFSGFKQIGVAQEISFKNVNNNSNQELDIDKSGPGRLYYTTRLKVAYKDIRKEPVNSGMQVKRTFYIKDKSGKWIPQTNHVKVRRGDLVRIELKTSIPSTRYHVALADALPAGLEPLNTALAATAKSEASDESDDSSGSYFWNEDDNWWGLYSSGGFYYREMRLFGAQYFADFLSRGEYTINYIAQAVAVGEFNVAPATIEQMYDPEVYGKSTPASFIVTE
ncbi:MAG: alpha-2-macroglobulin family protein [Bdellovibrionota bacterium]